MRYSNRAIMPATTIGELHMSNTLKAPKGGRIIKRTATDKADTAAPSVTVNFADLASNMVNAHHDATTAKRAIEADYVARLAGAESPLFGVIRSAAETCKGITEKQYDTLIAPAAKARYLALDYKDVSTRAAVLKVAFLAFAHGVSPSNDVSSNLQTFVNKEARAALRSRGVLAPAKDKGGRPEGSASTKVRSAREEAALCLAQTGGVDAEIVKARVHCLLALTSAGNWKLLDKALADAMRHVSK